MSAIQRTWTYHDLLEMPDDAPRREVIGGELFVTPAPTAGHQDVVSNLHILLREYAREFGGHVYLAPFDVVLSEFDVVQPDLLYLLPSRPRVPSDHHALRETPDLVIEVVSPGTRLMDENRKMALYASAGVPEYWIADPLRRRFVLRVLSNDEYVTVAPDGDGCFASRALRSLRVDPVDVFAGLD